MSATHERTQYSANLMNPVHPTRTDLVGLAPKRHTAGRSLAHQKSMKPNSNVKVT